MPCYTEITITVKDKAMAEAALQTMGHKGKVTKSANTETYNVTLDDQSQMSSSFRDSFFQEYGVQVTTQKAELEGYFVSRDTNENGEVELTLRQY